MGPEEYIARGRPRSVAKVWLKSSLIPGYEDPLIRSVSKRRYCEKAATGAPTITTLRKRSTGSLEMWVRNVQVVQPRSMTAGTMRAVRDDATKRYGVTVVGELGQRGPVGT